MHLKSQPPLDTLLPKCVSHFATVWPVPVASPRRMTDQVHTPQTRFASPQCRTARPATLESDPRISADNLPAAVRAPVPSRKTQIVDLLGGDRELSRSDGH